jgi:hypothetical protein
MPVEHSTLKLPKPPARRRQTRAVWLGFASVVLARLFCGRLPRPCGSDLKRHDYRASTQHMGVRLTERIRDTFRFRWIRRAS